MPSPSPAAAASARSRPEDHPRPGAVAANWSSVEPDASDSIAQGCGKRAAGCGDRPGEVHADDHVPHLRCGAGRAAKQAAVEDQPAADPGADREHDQMPAAQGAILVGLRERGARAVVVDEHGQPEALGEQRAQREVGERDVHAEADPARLELDDARDPDADGANLRQPEPVDHADHLIEQRLRAVQSRRLDPLGGQASRDETCHRDLRSPHVDADVLVRDHGLHAIGCFASCLADRFVRTHSSLGEVLLRSKLFMLLVVALTALMLVAAGCGDDEEEGGGGGAATTTESSGGGSTTTPSTGNAQADEAVQAAVESCKSSVNAVPNLKDDTKADLEKICEDAANGDAESVQKATKEVCEKIVEDTVPAGAAQDQAKQACAAAGG